MLQITALLSKKEKKLWRFISASVIGGLYSLVIFVENMPLALQILSKIVVTFLLIFVAFSFVRVVQYLKVTFVFFTSSLILLGICAGFSFLFKLKFLAINNSIIYFDLSAKTIIGCALGAYIVSSAFIRLYNRTLSKEEVYSLFIKNGDYSANLTAFLDTGNHLREPFSNEPVILAKSSICNNLSIGAKIRLVPITTVNGSSYINAFKPEYILLKSPKGEEVIEHAYIGLIDDVGNDGFQAILNYDILSL